MNLLEKLSGVEIRPDTRISEADRRYCAANQEAYDNAMTEFLSLREKWKAFVKQQEDILSAIFSESYEKERYLRADGLSSINIRKKIEALPDTFISCLVGYFNQKYHVSVAADEIKKALLPKLPEHSVEKSRVEEYHRTMRELKLRYEDVLEQIFVQLGGRTFEERALDELKEKCHNAAWNTYRNTADYEIKNNTIRFTGYACEFDDWIGREKWSLNDGMKDVLRAASHFETGRLDFYPSAISCLLGWNDKDAPVFEFPFTKLKQLRMFKNHRVDLKFGSSAYANEFAAEYLGLVA